MSVPRGVSVWREKVHPNVFSEPSTLTRQTNRLIQGSQGPLSTDLQTYVYLWGLSAAPVEGKDVPDMRVSARRSIQTRTFIVCWYPCLSTRQGTLFTEFHVASAKSLEPVKATGSNPDSGIPGVRGFPQAKSTSK
ncbi:hypothetical protein B0H16DRAFT_1449391 [Mycena metata]|uniref:Uncharacterized protein n=1 Tax=Mycena metata TaxID=1033252 RepID=A0AAD7K2Z6_9AGAR|nr:hypothetical protein B0H16DRAFT_1449391 [Mycena metata]